MKSPSTPKPDYGLYLGILSFFGTIIFFVLQANGVEVNWVVSALIYALCTVVIAWATLKLIPQSNGLARYGGAIILALMVVAAGVYGTTKQYRREHSVAEMAATPAVQPKAPEKPVVPGAGVPSTTTKPKILTKAAKPNKSSTIHGGDNTLVGNVGNRTIIGDGNTIVGATDSHGNTIINQGGTAIGNGACADSASIAIGAHANAGSCVPRRSFVCVSENNYCEALRDSELISKTSVFTSELNRWGVRESAAWNTSQDPKAFDVSRYAYYKENYLPDARRLKRILEFRAVPHPYCPGIKEDDARLLAEGGDNVGGLHREENLVVYLQCLADALRTKPPE